MTRGSFTQSGLIRNGVWVPTKVRVNVCIICDTPIPPNTPALVLTKRTKNADLPSGTLCCMGCARYEGLAR